MTIALLHLDTPEIANYGQISLNSKLRYAADFDHVIVEDKHERLDTSRPASWSKIPFIAYMFVDEYEWVWWLDADTLITNPAIDIATLCDPTADLIITADKNGICCGSFLMQNTDAARSLLMDVWKRKEFIDHQWWEQAAMQAVLKEGHPARVKVIEQSTINSFRETWKEGDLVVHFAGTPHDERLKVMRGWGKCD